MTYGDGRATPTRRPIRSSSESHAGRTPTGHPRLVALRHHASFWVAPAVLLIAALLPWPYGYYVLLRLAVFAASTLIAYEQWRFDDAVSGWVVAFGAVALLYNPIMPIHLTREIWSVVNVATAAVFLAHLGALRRSIGSQSSEQRPPYVRSVRRIWILPRSLSLGLTWHRPSGERDVTSHDKME